MYGPWEHLRMTWELWLIAYLWFFGATVQLGAVAVHRGGTLKWTDVLLAIPWPVVWPVFLVFGIFRRKQAEMSTEVSDREEVK